MPSNYFYYVSGLFAGRWLCFFYVLFRSLLHNYFTMTYALGIIVEAQARGGEGIVAKDPMHSVFDHCQKSIDFALAGC